jgi:hypothetical protein
MKRALELCDKTPGPWQALGTQIGRSIDGGFVGFAWAAEEKYPSPGKWTVAERRELATRIAKLLNDDDEKARGTV